MSLILDAAIADVVHRTPGRGLPALLELAAPGTPEGEIAAAYAARCAALGRLNEGRLARYRADIGGLDAAR